jgi:hypothetical protein
MATYAEVIAAYDENADYDLDGSAAKCQAFIVACRRLLSPALTTKRSVHGGRGGEEIELDLMLIKSQLEAAQQWLAANPPTSAGGAGGNVTHVDFTGFRD